MSARGARGLGAFALLAGFASYHWFALLADFAIGRWLALVATATAAAALLIAIERLTRAGWRRRALAGAVVFASVPVSLAVAGVANPGWPGGWDELASSLAGGLEGVSQVELPYSGTDEWTRAGILVAAPLALLAAVAVVFWPGGRREGLRRGAGLVIMVGLYGVAVTWEAPSAELVRGVALLVVISVYLWLPGAAMRRPFAAAAAVALAALAAVPAAARVDSREPLVSYTSWKIFGDPTVVSFDWDHSYGPLDWPQEGTELFTVSSDEPLYWKTVVLDAFDGVAWTRDDDGFSEVAPGYELAGVRSDLVFANEHWVREFEVTVSALRSDVAVTAGIAPRVSGLPLLSTAGDGTTVLADDQALEEGTGYSVEAYVPNPSAQELRKSPRAYPPGLERYTTMLLPRLPQAAEITESPLAFATVPPSGVVETRAERIRGALTPPIDEVVEGTAYEPVLGLARRLTRGAGSDWEAVARIQAHLLENYEYQQDVPARGDPIPAFLFQDRAGYCQQFSGAMALMLRMVGIPSRVAAGFAPGLPDPDTGEFTVRDTDAHSWVEVYFPDAGWVTVDPTPAAAPARTGATAGAGGSADAAAQGLGRAFSLEESADPGLVPDAVGRPPRSAEDGSPLAELIGLAALAGGIALHRRRRRRMLSPEGAELQVQELVAALPVTGVPAPAGATLGAIEAELGRSAGPDAARYAAGLRQNRYRAGRPRRPGPHERRLLRGALARGRGPLGFLRALRAIPPGGPSAP